MSGREDVLRALKSVNPRARAQDLAMYADAFCAYMEASENIEKNGLVVLHPRTGAPFENPYIKVRDSAVRVLRALKGVESGKLWER